MSPSAPGPEAGRRELARQRLAKLSGRSRDPIRVLADALTEARTAGLEAAEIARLAGGALDAVVDATWSASLALDLEPVSGWSYKGRTRPADPGRGRSRPAPGGEP